ncbi:hypothetical protein [Streptomyces sp. STCH 565 A]|uniref:hypothetical protein n=1 Tax=Streptomyces sp. STCH 565 A TaxID=2950532 RepID=UPI002075C4FA|nr:hypothetical protein [Streptomyces sp. STCH 565 A]MCM8555366.1 hypothetical protein [Streptomyces sp. STCH 565 A]
MTSYDACLLTGATGTFGLLALLGWCSPRRDEQLRARIALAGAVLAALYLWWRL